MNAAFARQFLRFGAVGTAGFVVDTAVLYTLLAVGLGPYAGRVFSYLAAATFTWFANRHFTFTENKDPRWRSEWFRFLASNAIGGAVNYLVYSLLVTFTVTVARHPVLGVAAGSIAGLIFNFYLSRRLVFRPAQPPRP